MELYTAEETTDDPVRKGFLEIRMRIWYSTIGQELTRIICSDCCEGTLKAQHQEMVQRLGYFRDAAIMDGWEDEDGVPSIRVKTFVVKKQTKKPTTAVTKSLVV